MDGEDWKLWAGDLCFVGRGYGEMYVYGWYIIPLPSLADTCPSF